MKRIAPAVVAVLVAALLAACGKTTTDPGGVVCTTLAAAGLNITVVDSLTGQPSAFAGLWARAKDGVYTDSSAMTFVEQPAGAVRMALAYEHPGTFAVTVHSAGYQDWIKSGVTVTKDVCHVIGVQLTARLVK